MDAVRKSCVNFAGVYKLRISAGACLSVGGVRNRCKDNEFLRKNIPPVYRVKNFDMKRALFLLAIAGLGACTSSHVPADYDPEECDALSVRIDGRDSLSQADYAAMIGQSEAILRYLTEQSARISELPDSLRNDAWRELQADPEYLERFGYMFTLGSTLYQADASGRLDEKNSRAFAALDEYNSRLAEYSDRSN